MAMPSRREGREHRGIARNEDAGGRFVSAQLFWYITEVEVDDFIVVSKQGSSRAET